MLYFLQVVLFLGNEIYQGSGQTIKSAKQMAAVQALQNTKYQSKKEQIASMPTMSKLQRIPEFLKYISLFQPLERPE